MGDPAAIEDPADLSRDSWKGVLRRTVREVREDRLDHWAAALTFYGVLSIFPALLVMTSLVGLFVDPAKVTRLLTDTLAELGPGAAESAVRGPVESLSSDRGSAGITLVLGAAAALWAASAYVSAFGDACNRMFEVREGRSIFKRKPLQMLVTLVLIVLATTIAFALLLGGPVVAALGSALGIPDPVLDTWRLAKWPGMALLAALIFVVLCRTVPNARMTGTRWLLPGAAAFLVVWIAASVLFALYAAHLGAYGRTYGALGGVAVFLVWMWLSNIALLFGVELSAELERGRQLEAGVPGAERRLQVEEREAAGPRPTTA